MEINFIGRILLLLYASHIKGRFIDVLKINLLALGGRKKITLPSGVGEPPSRATYGECRPAVTSHRDDLVPMPLSGARQWYTPLSPDRAIPPPAANRSVKGRVKIAIKMVHESASVMDANYEIIKYMSLFSNCYVS